MADLFDMDLRALRRDRAFRSGPALFLHERAFDDILDRLRDIRRSFDSALLVGVPDPGWPERLGQVAANVTAMDPGREFALAAGGSQVREDRLDVQPGSFDLCVAIGTLASVNDLPGALLRLRFALRPDSLLIGAMSGGGTLPRLRHAMHAADSVAGAASPHVHPRIDPPGLCTLLASAGFAIPVVDVDRVSVSYRSLAGLVRDLRGMGETNILTARSPTPLGKSAFAAASEAFRDSGNRERTVETFEILHFAAWTAAERD